jgi:hypothetical protein
MQESLEGEKDLDLTKIQQQWRGELEGERMKKQFSEREKCFLSGG